MNDVKDSIVMELSYHHDPISVDKLLSNLRKFTDYSEMELREGLVSLLCTGRALLTPDRKLVLDREIG